MYANLKKELIDKISATDDENLLLLLKTDYDHFAAKNEAEVTDDLSEEDKNELITLVNKPFGKDTISQQELDEAIWQWRMK